ncbi:unnamed protein product [Leptosia nina]|uniref:DNA-directed DNA polymerase n=1 Tax=Leptosia nina TaxID=320188 RepID=A0AAV1JBQ5_9NEOP
MAINQHSGFVFSEEVDISELEDVFEDLALLQVSETFEQDQKFDPQYDEELSRICDQVGSGVLKRINSGEINNVSAKRVRLEEPTTSRGSAAAEQSSTLHGNLEKLAKNLKDDEFHELRLHFPNQNDFDRLRQKGVFPYEYMTSLECFDLTFLPNKKHFRSSLTNNDISDADYNRALDVWQHFGCENMLDYSNLYLKTDVLLLTDVFENFRRLCIKTYGLDPAHYYTAPGLSWDAMLKKTNVKLELLTDIDQIAFIKAGIRGGISQCSNRYAKSNNKYLEDFDKNIPSSYIIYLDANNLYGWAMSQYLPEGGFKWVSLDTNFNIPDTSEYGYILEVDLEYSQDLHDKHSDFPMCPENVNIGGTMFRNLVAFLFCTSSALYVDGNDTHSTATYDPAELLSNIFKLENNTLGRSAQFTTRKKHVRQFDGSLSTFGYNGYPPPHFNHGLFYERPSFATEALSRVTEALTSIALYDDYQCVPRLLCEAAGGGALGPSNLLQSVAGLQPLLTLLSGYSGISSNPLFVFGRAVLLGMSSKENPGTCRYAYQHCPTDPEQLVHYLNNHNGGFFRFFNSPHNGQQNVEQFYNHLQGYEAQQGIGPQNLDNGQYGFYQRPSGTHAAQSTRYGLYNFQNQNNFGFQTSPYYAYNQHRYGQIDPSPHRFQNSHYSREIQKRIQNKPNEYNSDDYKENDRPSKWIFPHNYPSANEANTVKNRREKAFKFPIVEKYISEGVRDTGFVFPNADYNRKRIEYFNNNNYYQNGNTDKSKSSENDYVTVYVVRGNGDPKNPEIINLRHGETL